MSNAMKPTAEGNFQKTPFGNVLLYARERKMTGSLVITIRPDDPAATATLDVAGISTLVLDAGSVVAVQTPSQTETLSWVLHEMGAISEEAFLKVQHAVMEKGGGSDEVPTLLRLRATDPPTLDRGLRELARRRILGLFGFSAGNYAYYANVDLLAGAERLRSPEDVLPIVWRSFMKVAPDPAQVTGVIDKLGNRALRLRENHEIDRFEFGDELGLAPTQLRTAPSALEQLMGLAPEPESVRRMIFLLALTKQVEVAPAASSPSNPNLATSTKPPPIPAAVGARPPPVPAGAMRTSSSDASEMGRRSASDVSEIGRLSALPAPPPEKPPEKPDPSNHPRWKEAESHLARMQNKNYFEMFELSDSGTLEEIRAAFPRTVAPWHPDKVPIPELTALYEEIFGLYNTAYSTLTNKDGRKHYEESLHGGGGTPAAQKKVAAVLDTVQDVHRAEIALRRKDYVEAERLLRRTLAASDDDVAALLTLAQLLLEVDPTRNADEVIQLTANVLKSTEGNDRARVYLGQALKVKGDFPRARACFKQALEMNANNVEASRELRLLEMRMQQKRDEKAAQGSIGGLFNKFLKK